MKPENPARDLQQTVDRPADPNNASTMDVTGADQPAPDTEPTLPGPSCEAPMVPGYVITGEIARGGMGRVLAGRELALDREVAIKVLLSGADAARFVTESKITAKLPHPNIPPVYALGALADGSPYLAMKYIRGRTLADELKARPNPKAELPRFLQIFEQIAQAVGFAHARGLIHRDLKPANVMVGEFGEVQVMDWGLAREVGSAEFAVPSEDSEMRHPEMTQPGAIMGTPAYMAPEQARGESVDARADVFALGGILTAILTGKAVFVGGSAVETIQRAASGDTGDALVRLSACGADAELQTIARLTLAVRPEERPADGLAVAAAVAKYRHGVADRLRKAETDRAASEATATEQAKRRRAIQYAGGIVAIALVLGVIGTTVGLFRARDSATKELEAKIEAEGKQAAAETAERAERLAKQEALDEKAKAELAERETLNAYRIGTDEAIQKLIGSKRELGPQERAYLENTSRRWQIFAARVGDDEHSRRIRGEGLFRVATIWQKLGRTAEAVPKLEEALAIREKLADDHPAVPEYQEEFANTCNNLAFLNTGLGDPISAEKLNRQAVVRLVKLVAEFPSAPDYRQALVTIRNNLGNLFKSAGRQKEAEEEYKEVLSLGRSLIADFPKVADYRSGMADSLNNMGNLLNDLGKYNASLDHYDQALSLREKLVQDFPASPDLRKELIDSYVNSASQLVVLGRHTVAEKQFERAVAIGLSLVADFPSVPVYRQALATAHIKSGNLADELRKRAVAERNHSAALAICEKLAADFPKVPSYREDVATIHNNLGVVCNRLGLQSEEEQHFEKALAIRDKLATEYPGVPAHRQSLAQSCNNVGFCLVAAGKTSEAIAQNDKATGIREKLVAEFPLLPVYRQELAISHINAGNMHAAIGKTMIAEAAYLKSLALMEKLVSDFPLIREFRQELANGHNNLGALLRGMGKQAEAEQHYRKGLGHREKLVADFPGSPVYAGELGMGYFNLANSILTGGKPAESLPWFDKAIDSLARIYADEPRNVRVKQTLRSSYSARAQAKFQFEQFTAANADWDKTIELSPVAEHPRYRAPRALSRLRAGLFEEALAEAAELTKILGWNGERLFWFACIYSASSGKNSDKKQEYADRAMELMQKAVKAGYADAATIAKDPDLDPLRKRDDFKNLQTDLEKK